jgi:hypothetical protein
VAFLYASDSLAALLTSRQWLQRADDQLNALLNSHECAASI